MVEMYASCRICSPPFWCNEVVKVSMLTCVVAERSCPLHVLRLTGCVSRFTLGETKE
jgi:hypothetical protein